MHLRIFANRKYNGDHTTELVERLALELQNDPGVELSWVTPEEVENGIDQYLTGDIFLVFPKGFKTDLGQALKAWGLRQNIAKQAWLVVDNPADLGNHSAAAFTGVIVPERSKAFTFPGVTNYKVIAEGIPEQLIVADRSLIRKERVLLENEEPTYLLGVIGTKYLPRIFGAISYINEYKLTDKPLEILVHDPGPVETFPEYIRESFDKYPWFYYSFGYKDRESFTYEFSACDAVLFFDESAPTSNMRSTPVRSPSGVQEGTKFPYVSSTLRFFMGLGCPVIYSAGNCISPGHLLDFLDARLRVNDLSPSEIKHMIITALQSTCQEHAKRISGYAKTTIGFSKTVEAYRSLYK